MGDFIIKQLKRLFNLNGSQQKDVLLEEPMTVEIKSEMDKYQILSKTVYINYDGKKEKFTNHFKHVNGSDILYEKNKYFEIAQSIYDSFGIDEYIENLLITSSRYFEDSGTTDSKIINDTLKITISIASRKLGIVNHSEYIHQFTREKLKEFIDVFAHEMFHAKSSVEIVKHYGINEFKKIKEEESSIAKIAWIILDEYSVCKDTAEQYNSFDSIEDVASKLNSQYLIMTDALQKTEVSKNELLKICFDLNYAVATRCAYADVSGDEKKHLQIDRLKENQLCYMENTRKLLMEYNSLRPLNYARYNELGVSLIRYMLADLHGMQNKEIDNKLSKFT